MTTETEIKKEIMDGIKREFGDMVHVFRVWCGMTIAKRGGIIHGAANGTPDLSGLILAGKNSGRFLGIEVKKPKAHYRCEQVEFMSMAKDAGAFVLGVTSWEDCKEKLTKLF